MDQSKTCRTCGITKPLTQFVRNRRQKNGRGSRCLPCHREKNRQWRESNLAKHNACNRYWDQQNYLYNRWRRGAARAKAAESSVFGVNDKDMRRLVHSACVLCGETNDITLDHIIPISRGGSHGVGNLQPMCFWCNDNKGDELMVEYRAKWHIPAL